MCVMYGPFIMGELFPIKYKCFKSHKDKNISLFLLYFNFYLGQTIKKSLINIKTPFVYG